MNKSDSRPPLSWRDAAIAFSLANLSFLNLWSQLLTYTRPDRYTMKYAPAPALYGGLILDVVLYGAVLWAGIAACRRLKGHAATLARLGFLLLLVLPLNALRAAMSQHVPFLKSDLILKIGVKGVIILAAVLGLTAALAALRFPRQLARAAASVLLLFSPFVAVTFLQGAWKMARYDPRPFADGPPASPPLQVAKTSPRFLWVIFDEWDQRLTFPERLPRLKLPAIDRIRRESLYASNAIPAGPETTISMPAMTTGRLVETFRHGDANELFLRMADNKQVVSWGKLPNVFADARAAGFRTAVAGWYQPYCRVINHSLDACWWWELAAQHTALGRGLAETAPNEARSLFETSLLSPFGQSLSTAYHAKTYHEMLARAKQLAGDRNFGLVLLHFPVPHAPHAYDRKTGAFTLANAAIKGYYDSLALTDRSIAALRRAMERAGTWDTTTVLFSSDHSYRSAGALDGKTDRRVPFLLKLAGQREGVTFDAGFNTVVTHDLILAVLRREISTPGQAVEWLGRRKM
ncbi:MAG: sulfatase-like hydrolase/transferase [Acidobacteriota bacterium]